MGLFIVCEKLFSSRLQKVIWSVRPAFPFAVIVFTLDYIFQFRLADIQYVRQRLDAFSAVCMVRWQGDFLQKIHSIPAKFPYKNWQTVPVSVHTDTSLCLLLILWPLLSPLCPRFPQH